MRVLVPIVAFPVLLAACGQSPNGDTSRLNDARPAASMALTAADPTDITLPITQIYDQGSTEWCWAFSTFHTLRTYHYNSTSGDATIAAWKTALQSIDSQDKFTGFMGQNEDQGSTGDPSEFVELMQNQFNLKSEGWTNYYSFDHPSVRAERLLAQARPSEHAVPLVGATRDNVIQKMIGNLQKGVPSVFCNTSHCRMMYGVTLSNGKPTNWTLADSLGGKTEHLTDSDFEGQLDLVLTLP